MCRFVGESGDDSHAILSFECPDSAVAIAVHFSAGPGPRLRKWSTVTNTGDRQLILFDVVLERFPLAPDAYAWGGGRGWPIFVGGLGYFAIEYPEAENRLVDGSCILEYYPAVAIEPGESYETERALLEFAPDDPEAALHRYTDEFRVRKSDRLFTSYGTWGAHEYEGPNATIVREQLSHLADLKANWHIPIEHLMVDYGYWAEGEDPLATGRYSIDRDTKFPGDSFAQITAGLAESKLRLGMWFGLRYPAFEDAIDNLKRSILDLNSAFGLKLARIHAESQESGKYEDYTSARRMIDLLTQLKSADPEIIVHVTGFSRSPWWLRHADYAGLGDGDLSDTPAPSLRDSQMIKVDLDRRFFELDLSTNISFSDAAFWSGKQFWRKSVIMSMARCNQLCVAGDLSILDDEDKLFLQRLAQHHSASKQSYGHARRVMGDPASGEVYGYANIKDGRGMVAIYNPTWVARTVELQALDFGCAPEIRNMVIELFPSTQAASMLEWESCDLRFNPWELKLLEISPSRQHYELFESRIENVGKYPMPITAVSPPSDGAMGLSLPLERVFYRTGSAFRCLPMIPKEWEGHPVLVDLCSLTGELYINNLPSGIFGGSSRLFYPGTREYAHLGFGRANMFYVAVDDPSITRQDDLVIRPLGYSSSSTCREDWPHAKVSSMVVIIRYRKDGMPVRPSADPRMAQCAIWLDGIWMEAYRVPPLVPRIRSGYSWSVFALDLEGDWECARVIVPHFLEVDYDIEFFLTDRIPAITSDQ